MATLGGKISKKDQDFKRKKKDKRDLPKILVLEKNRLKEALKKNKYLKKTVDKYEKKLEPGFEPRLICKEKNTTDSHIPCTLREYATKRCGSVFG